MVFAFTLSMALSISSVLAEKYPECEIELNQGGQPIYYYLISVE